MAICLACGGTGYQKRMRDVSHVYGYKLELPYTKPCEFCGTSGQVSPPPPSGKMAAAGEKQDE